MRRLTQWGTERDNQVNITHNSSTATEFEWDYITSFHNCQWGCQGLKLGGITPTISVKYSGNTATLFSPNDTNGDEFTIESTAASGGGIAIVQTDLDHWGGSNSSWTNVQSVKVSLNNDPTNPADYPAYESLGYTLYQIKPEAPALPLYAGTYVSTNDFVYIAANGTQYLGSEFTYVNITGGNGLEIDNANHKITAYVSGVYELKATLSDGTTFTIYATVKNKGDASWKIYEIDFTESDDAYLNLGYVNNNSGSDTTNPDAITYNGATLTAEGQGPALPTGWTSYYLGKTNPPTGDGYTDAFYHVNKYPLQTPFPYTNSDGSEIGVKTGLVPFANPDDLGYNNIWGAAGYFVLNNNIINAFSDLTVNVDMYVYSSNSGSSGFQIGGRIALNSDGSLKLDGTTPINTIGILPADNCTYHNQGGTSVVMSWVRDNHAWGSDNDAEYANVTSGSTTAKRVNWSYIDSLHHESDWNCGQSKSGIRTVLSVAYSGNTATLSSPNDSEGKRFTVESTPTTGGIAICQTQLNEWGASSWTNVQSVSVALNNADGDCPRYTSFEHFLTNESSYIYGTVGDAISLNNIMVQMGETFATGSTLTWNCNSTKATIAGGVITLNEKGAVNVTVTNGTNTLTVVIAIKDVGEEFFSNGNYDFEYTNGNITAVKLLDASAPYTSEVSIPDRFTHSDGTWTNIFTVSASFGANSGKYNQMVQKVTFGKYIETIGAFAFENATALREVELSERLIEIGANAFKNTALTSVVIPARVDKIGDGAFANCFSLTSVEITNPDIEIGAGAFTANTVVYGPEAIREKVLAAGGQFEVISADKLNAGTQKRTEVLTIEQNRINTVDNEAVIYTEDHGTGWGNYISKIIYGNRDAGKYVITDKMETIDVNSGTKELREITYISTGFTECPDKDRILSIEVKEWVNNWNGTFTGLTGLKEVKLHDSFTVGYRTFKGCTSLETVTIPAGAATIGLELFDGCSSLKEIKFTENSQATLLGCNTWNDVPRAFMNGTLVEKIELPVSVTQLTPDVFKYTNLNEIVINNKYTEFSGEGAFFPAGTVIYGVAGSTAQTYAEANGYTFVAISDYYTTNANTTDNSARFITELVDGKYYSLVDYIGIGGKVVIPAYATAKDGSVNAPIYSVSSSVLQNGTNGVNGTVQRFVNVEISEGIYKIDENAFKGAERLESIKFPVTLKTIGKAAFANTALKGNVEIPKNVTEIGAGAFQGSKNITDVYIYNANTEIKGNAFEKTVKIHGIAGSTAEEYAKKNGIEFIEIQAPKAETVSDVTNNGNYVFTVDANGVLTGYSRRDNSVAYSAKVEIPTTVNGVKVTAIGENLFEEGAEAASVYALVIPDGVTAINNNAFKNCVALTYISLGNTVETIGDSAFEGTALKGDLTLPESVTQVGQNAFKGLADLSSVTVLNKACVLKANSIPRINSNFVLIGYSDSTAEKFAENYKMTFKAIDGTEVNPDTDKDPDKDYTGNKADPVEDPTEEPDDVSTFGELDLTLIIVIAAAVLVIVLLLGAGIIVILVVKSKQNNI